MSEKGSCSNENKYAVLVETNGKELESWYYFIRYNGNEDALKHLKEQIEKVELYILDDLSTYDLDLENLVSEQTAKEMTKLEVNAFMYHRKFDGKMKTIDFGFKKSDKNDRKLVRIFKAIGVGSITEYVSDEDVSDDEDDSSDESSDSDHSTEYEYGVSESDDSDHSESSSNSDSSSDSDESPPRRRKDDKKTKKDDKKDDKKEKTKKKEELLSSKELNDRRARNKILEMRNKERK